MPKPSLQRYLTQQQQPRSPQGLQAYKEKMRNAEIFGRELYTPPKVASPRPRSIRSPRKLRLPIPDGRRSMRSRYSSGGDRCGLGFRSYTVTKFLYTQPRWCLDAVLASMHPVAVRYPVVSACYLLIVTRLSPAYPHTGLRAFRYGQYYS